MLRDGARRARPARGEAKCRPRERAGALRVAVTAPPEKGKANAAIGAVLAESLGCRSSQIALISGETSRQKRFLVIGVTPDDLRRRLAAVDARRRSNLASIVIDRAMSLYPAEITIDPWSGPPPGASVRVPGSKSLTNRALVIAAMADGPSTLTGALDSEDTRVMVEALRTLGIAVVHDTATARDPALRAAAAASRSARPAWTSPTREPACGSSPRCWPPAREPTGSTARRGCASGRSPTCSRPCAAWGQTPAATWAPAARPSRSRRSGLDGGSAFVRGDVSSQFLSGLLMAMPLCQRHDHGRGAGRPRLADRMSP